MQENKRYLWVLALLACPFYLNDFANIYVKDWRLWLLIDYTCVKFFPLLIVLWLLCRKTMTLAEFGLTRQPVLAFLAVFCGATLIGTAIDQNAYQLIAELPGYRALGGMPEITSPVWNWIDLTLGLLAVGFFEELIFRGYLHTVLSRYFQNSAVIVAISSLVFGLIHWSLGLHAVLITATISAVFMLFYLRTRSLPAIMLAHFALNFIDFAGVIPKALFRFV